MNLETIRHSTSHVLAAAVKRLYPKVKLGIGPAIEDGFYYDFGDLNIKEEDLESIEKEMRKIIAKDEKFIQKLISRKEAEKILRNEPYKLDLLKDLDDDKISFYYTGEFFDLCKGPHIKSTKEIKAFKLTKLAGAYWRGDSENDMLQRIYGIAFESEKELKEHLRLLEEAEKRNHIKLGKELDLFVFSDVVGKGLPLLTPKGTIIKRILERFIEDEEIKRGYQYTETPVLAKSDLYKISGHLDHYRESMFVFEANGEEMVLRPMTCPHQFMIYKSKLRSYKDLPIRYAEIADLFRNEQSGELHGLIRIRQFSLADAHIICMPEQLEKEFEDVLNLIKYVMKTLGFKNYWYRFSKWDPKNKKKYIDNPKAWDISQKTMKKILDKLKLEYIEADDEAAFYGPKLDIQMKNVYGKEDTIFTVQIDFALPERFDMTYEGEDGRKHRPMIIHRSSIGCLERTMAMLIEHYAGAFPLWLSPIQVRIMNLTDRNIKFCEKIAKELEKNGIRVETDYSKETMNKKVRNAQLQKIPYMITIGDKEEEKGTLAVRTRNGNVRFGIRPEDLIKEISEKVENKDAD
ncbi:MAG: threonine--tRNA ligase [Candidatus Nanoarchaeia archaeon]|nr:threonine--tRNA ligase [Candidatus Nanoarchaeia archaeon]